MDALVQVLLEARQGDRFIVAGRYSDSLVRTEDGWCIAHRRRETWWTDGNPAVVSA